VTTEASPRDNVERIAAGDGTVWVGEGLLRDARRFLVSPSGRFLLVAPASARAASDPIRAALGDAIVLDLEIDDGEAAKSLATVEKIAGAALGAGLRRDDAFVAVGGGVATDVTGFAAAILLRGVAWNAVPTTTAGMADAAIGGKTAVNHPRGKNLLGAFHPPRTVLADPACLSTLSDRDYRAGLVEAYKAAWVADAALATRAVDDLPAILERRSGPLVALLAGAVRVKAGIVADDPRDAGRRHLLNFGHTLGHAFEAAAPWGALRHGEAVAWGIAAALVLSQRRAGLPSGAAEVITRTLARLGPFPSPERQAARLAPLLALDKKATSEGMVGVLLEGIGRGRVEKSIPIEEWLDAAAIMSLS
jgi:3-dehydroquinate synthase